MIRPSAVQSFTRTTELPGLTLFLTTLSSRRRAAGSPVTIPFVRFGSITVVASSCVISRASRTDSWTPARFSR